MIGINKGALKATNPNLKLELKFNYQTYTDLAGTVAATTNDYVRAWRSNVNGINTLLTQSTDAARPQMASDGLYFDGGDSLAVAPIFDLASYTISFWVKPDALGGGLIHRGYYTTAGLSWTGLTYSIRLLGGGSVRFYFYGTASTNEQYITVNILSVGVWTHVAMIRNGTNGAVYANGGSVGTITGLNTCAASTQPLRVGMWDYNGGAEHFSGKMTDIRIYDVAKYTANFTPPTRSA